MKKWPWLIVLFAVLVTGMAFAGERTVQKKAKDFSVEIQMEKDPPVVGANLVEIIVTDADGRAVKDAKVIVTAFMPAMPGSPLEMNTVEARLEGGKYKTKMVFSRGGFWEMSIQVIQGGKTTMAKWTVEAR